MLFDRTRISYDMLCWRSGRWRRWRQGDRKVFGTELRRVMYVFYLFIFRSFYFLFFFYAHSCCNHKLDSQKNERALSGVASWRDCCTTASTNALRSRWGNDFSSWALDAAVSIEDFIYSAAMPRCTSHFPLKEQFGWKWKLCRYLLSSCLSKLVWRNFF